MPTWSNSASDARSGAIARIGGLQSCQPSAPCAGDEGLVQVHPEAGGRIVAPPAGEAGERRPSPWRSCTKQPATAPGPAFRYL